MEILTRVKELKQATDFLSDTVVETDTLVDGLLKTGPKKSQLSTMGCSNWIDRQKEEQLTINDWLNITS